MRRRAGAGSSAADGGDRGNGDRRKANSNGRDSGTRANNKRKDRPSKDSLKRKKPREDDGLSDEARKLRDLYRKLKSDLGPEKAKEHFEKKQCLKCHQTGHVLRDCPKLK